MSSVFPILGLDRSATRWEEHLGTLTPWELRDGVWFKREDHFAPLGYGGPNGSKLRQLIWLMNRQREGKTHVLSGASVQSPQLSMSAIVGAHYGLPTRLVVYSRPDTVMRHPNPRIAAGFGATVEYAAAPYNPVIQRHVSMLRRPDSLVVEYGITLDHQGAGAHPAEDVRKFHLLGAHQVSNIPPEVETLIVPAGSCNSLTSVVLGLALHRNRHRVRRLLTLGIGPDKSAWMRSRLLNIGVEPEDCPYKWEHVSLHDTRYAAYSDKFHGEHWAGIDFHPTYEAKMWRWLRQHADISTLTGGSTGFWVVGSEPRLEVVRPYFTHPEPIHHD